MKILFILQNAYYTGAYRPANEQQWFRDLMRSYTGKRMAGMIPEGAEIAATNASPIIGTTASSCFPADLKHLRKQIRKHKPDVICACGKIAQQGLDQLGIQYVAAPHPAWRALSKEHIARIRQQLGEQNEQ